MVFRCFVTARNLYGNARRLPSRSKPVTWHRTISEPHTDAQPNADSKPESDADANTNGLSDTHCDSDANGLSDTYGNADSGRDADADANPSAMFTRCKPYVTDDRE